MKLTFSSSGEVMWTPWYGVYRWDRHMVSRPGTYAVIVTNGELSTMQDVQPGRRHPTCVVDDFGSLVRVAA